MRSSRPSAFTPTTLFSCVLSYALLLSALSPFASRKVEAAPGATESAPPAEAAATQSAGPRRREGEVIVRFREGVAEDAKGAAVSSRGGRRKARLRGESGLEKVGLAPGQDPAAAMPAIWTIVHGTVKDILLIGTSELI